MNNSKNLSGRGVNEIPTLLLNGVDIYTRMTPVGYVSVNGVDTYTRMISVEYVFVKYLIQKIFVRFLIILVCSNTILKRKNTNFFKIQTLLYKLLL